jgi:nucleoside-diphosphate-sugar epimerase
MRVFVTGATGFIGFGIVKELIAAGHEVTGLARFEASAKRLREIGAKTALGDSGDLSLLRRSAADAEGAVHTAFYHKLSHMPLATRLRVFVGGAPGGIVMRFMGAAIDADRHAIETIGAALPGNGSPLVATFGTLGMKAGRLATEDESYDREASFTGFRARNEDVLKALGSRGVRTSAIRLPPIVHGPGAYGLASMFFQSAQKRRVSAYLDDGANRWPSVHRDDAARLFRLALEKGAGGGAYHGVAEEGVPLRDIAAAIGKRLNVPVASKSKSEAAKHFGFIAPLVGIDNPTSSRLTRERLGWEPTGIGVLADLERAQLP